MFLAILPELKLPLIRVFPEFLFCSLESFLVLLVQLDRLLDAYQQQLSEKKHGRILYMSRTTRSGALGGGSRNVKLLAGLSLVSNENRSSVMPNKLVVVEHMRLHSIPKIANPLFCMPLKFLLFYIHKRYFVEEHNRKVDNL